MSDSHKIYDIGKSYLEVPFKKILAVIASVLSPTWAYAKRTKENQTQEQRAKGIIARNYFYLSTSIITTVAFCFLFEPSEFIHLPLLVKLLFLVVFFYGITWSRCNEILLSFITDALEKSANQETKSTLTFNKRIKLSLLSYIELILNYSILYVIMPLSWFTENFENMGDAIYFSGVTITTLGYGDFSPIHFLPKLLVIHEVLAGFTLIVVSFAIYAGRTENSTPDQVTKLVKRNKFALEESRKRLMEIKKLHKEVELSELNLNRKIESLSHTLSKLENVTQNKKIK